MSYRWALLLRIAKLDQNNISNAYVSGMSEELGFGPGNELSWMNTYFSIGKQLVERTFQVNQPAHNFQVPSLVALFRT